MYAFRETVSDEIFINMLLNYTNELREKKVTHRRISLKGRRGGGGETTDLKVCAYCRRKLRDKRKNGKKIVLDYSIAE